MLIYEKYNKTSFCVRVIKENGDIDSNIEKNRRIYAKILKSVNARWNSRMKNGTPGWLVKLEKEEDLINLIDSINDKKPSYKSIKNQKKYRKEVSDSEDDYDNLLDINENETYVKEGKKNFEIENKKIKSEDEKHHIESDKENL